MPEFRPDLIVPLLPSAVTVALLAAIESLLSAVVADNMSGDKHKPDVELVAQGVANMVVPLFGGIPATGAIARTATNIRSGAQIAGRRHRPRPDAAGHPAGRRAAGPLHPAGDPGRGAVRRRLQHERVARDRHHPAVLEGRRRASGPRTFALTVFADLTVAVEVGMVLAAILYIYQVTATTSVESVTDEYIKDGQAHILQDKQIPVYVTILRIHGPFLFGATDKLEEATTDLNALQLPSSCCGCAT